MSCASGTRIITAVACGFLYPGCRVIFDAHVEIQGCVCKSDREGEEKKAKQVRDVLDFVQ